MFGMIKDFFAGKKTHIIVLLTILANTFQNVANEGGDFGDIGMWIENAKLAMVSTFKMMFDRR
jgi:hypothetical protein